MCFCYENSSIFPFFAHFVLFYTFCLCFARNIPEIFGDIFLFLVAIQNADPGLSRKGTSLQIVKENRLLKMRESLQVGHPAQLLLIKSPIGGKKLPYLCLPLIEGSRLPGGNRLLPGKSRPALGILPQIIIVDQKFPEIFPFPGDSLFNESQQDLITGASSVLLFLKPFLPIVIP